MEIKPELYEKLGAFYLGREYDLDATEMGDEVVLYDSKDLTTHAVCVGMTGSGKTGLCISLLEEAAIDGVPAIIIDPKGDIANLLLTFPDLAPADFRPWINEDAARREGVTPDECAAAQAELWKGGLASWGQDGDRVRRLRDAADVTIYTPGSESGIPVSILRSFDAPPQAILDDGDAFRDRVSSTATSVLGLLDIDADPLTSREHILLANILEDAWKNGRSMDLASLIHAIQKPGFQRVGVMDLESFYPSKDRFDLATRFNNLLASPEFSSWMTGAALDADQLLYDAKGAPRVAIFSIAHLSDPERMFFVSLLLNQVVGWMRSKPGTSSLRALLYIDELFGFMPPVANPPSKQPLLTMLKQARAFGVGLLLATQNPMDLDYKGLSNTGTWFIGRLQTDRDKARILEGLEGAGETGMDRKTLDRILSNLDKRVFLLHNVHERTPVTFHTRWAMSYLAGPLTRTQIKTLMDPRRGDNGGAATVEAKAPAAAPSPPSSPAPRVASPDATSLAPVLPPGVEQRFFPEDSDGGSVSYRPFAFAEARVHLVDTRKGLADDETLHLLAPIGAGGRVAWNEAEQTEHVSADLKARPVDGASFSPLPASAGTTDAVRAWKDALEEELYRSRRTELFEHDELDLYSEPGESERDFRIRISEALRAHRDSAVEALREKYASKVERLEERIRKADQKIDRETEQAEAAKTQGLVSIGTTILSALIGRKLLSRSTVGRASTAMRGVVRGRAQAGDVERAVEDRENLEQEQADLLSEIEQAVDDLAIRLDPMNVELSTTTLKPRRTDIDVGFVGLAWVP